MGSLDRANIAILVLLSVLAALLAAGASRAASFNVTKVADTNDGVCDADCSLREAIVAANASPGLDDVVVPSGSYTLTIPGTFEDLGATGDLDITDDLALRGAGSANTILDGNAADRVLEIHAGASSVIADLTVQNGNSYWSGGGIFNQGTLLLSDSRVVSNVDSPSGGNGGGILNLGAADIIRSSVSGNSAFLAGGGISNGATGILTLTDSTLSGNVVGGDGGGIRNDGSATLIRSTVSGNSQTEGSGLAGGILNAGSGTLSIINSTVSGNSAPTVNGRAGVVSGHSAATGTLTNSTVSGNVGNLGGGLMGGAGSWILKNTIVAGNSPNNCFGQPTSNGHNMDDDGSCGFTAPGDLSNVADPKLGPLQNNGGLTLTHAPLLGSPAIDTADGAVCAGATVGAVDQRSVLRPLDGNGDLAPACDIGALELTECGDGLDNDGDTQIDFGNDLQCTGFDDTLELCGFGPSLALVVPLLMWVYGRRAEAVA